MKETWWNLVTVFLVISVGIYATVEPNPTIAAVTHANNISTNSSTTNISLTTPRPTPVPTTQKPTEFPEEKVESPDVEQHSSLTIFFILLVIALCILVTHFLIKTKFHYLPESVAVVFLGALIGLVMKALRHFSLGDWQREEHFNPTAFFLILLPPIIFESGYSLHKGNFFSNIGSIVIYAVFGTAISAIVIGGGIYLLGKGGIAFQLGLRESTILSLGDPQYASMSSIEAFFSAVVNFMVMFVGSAALGIGFALVSALISFIIFTDIHMYCQMNVGLNDISPVKARIMAILFCGICMSHYTHFNLSPMTQITVQQIFRTAAFMAETCVFAYLGMAIFSFQHQLKPAFVIWSIILCLTGRALNIFPLSALVNQFRDVKIDRKTQCVMWFSGLRGAVAFALVLHLRMDDEKRHVLITSTLIIVLFTILCLGGSTLPLLKFLKVENEKGLTMSKTETEGTALDADKLTDDEWRIPRRTRRGFTKLDAKYFLPFFTRKFTRQEVRDSQNEMQRLTSNLYNEVYSRPNSEDETESKL
ncbi:hypothetical protein QZH41_012878 [Actinostola sp. cb2023]|nr:hypothetical protein QZH41_012878 [Actinostola sp. cb2023]